MSSSKVSARNAVKFFFSSACNISGNRENFLCKVSTYIPPEKIVAAMLNENVLRLYFASFEDAKFLLERGIDFDDEHLAAFPLLCAFTVSGIPPTFKNDELERVFSAYGVVSEVQKISFCPGSSRFSHVLGSDRRVFLDGSPLELNARIPSSITLPFGSASVICSVVPHCMFCEEDGHSFSQCQSIRQKFKRGSPSVGDNPANEAPPDRSPILIPGDVFQCLPPILEKEKDSFNDATSSPSDEPWSDCSKSSAVSRNCENMRKKKSKRKRVKSGSGKKKLKFNEDSKQIQNM